MADNKQVVRPRKDVGGNTKPDIEWLEEVGAAGELLEPDQSTKPPNFLYDVHYQWNGYADEVNMDFFEAFRRSDKHCNGTAYIRDGSGMYIVDLDWERLTRPCLRPPSRGTVVCTAHGARIPHVKAAAERVIAEAAELVAERLVHMTGTRDELQEAIDHKVRLAAMNSVLDRAGIKSGSTVEIELPGYKKVLEALFSADPEPSDE